MGITQIDPVVRNIDKLQCRPVRWLCVRIKRQPHHLRPQAAQPQHKPRPFEACVPGYEYAAPCVQATKGGHAHTFHGAWPLSQSSSSLFLSRSVSMGCQKPRC